MKIIDVGRKMVLHRVEGYLLARVVDFLLNVQVQPRRMWLTRHGESEFNVLGRIGGDAHLSAAGRAYANQLAVVVREGIRPSAMVWTSTLRRTIETAEIIRSPLPRVAPARRDRRRGLRWDDVRRDLARRCRTSTRPGRATSSATGTRVASPAQDVIQRLEPVIFELEREKAPDAGHRAPGRAPGPSTRT